MNKYLTDLARKVRGIVLVTGYEDDVFMNALEKNSKITRCDTLIEIPTLIRRKKSELKTNGNTKKVKIKKIKRAYKNNSVDYLFVDGIAMKKYLRKFIRNSIEITNKEIYFLGNDIKLDIENIKKRFKRYNVEIKEKTNKDDYFLIINVEKKKKHTIKKYGYYFVDLFYDMFDFIGDIIST